MAAPIQEIAGQFSKLHHTPIELDLGGSETLLPKILAGARADVFVCHDPFEQKISMAKLCSDSVVVGYLEPVLAVRPGNPKKILALGDLTRPGLKIGMGDPRYSTCGELFVRVLREQHLYDNVIPNVILQARSHAEVANGLVVGPLDAVIVWNFIAPLYPGKLEIIPTGAIYPVTRVTVLGLTRCDNPTQRDAFLDWCRQPAAREIFRNYGYKLQHP